MKKWLISFLIILVTFNYVHAAALWDWSTAVNTFYNWFNWLVTVVFGLPPEWAVFPEILYYFFLPLIGIFVIIYGFLDAMRIFDNNNLNVILAIVIALSALISKLLVGFVRVVFGLLGPIGVGAFGILFLGGVNFISKKKRAEWGTKTGVLSTYHGEAEKLKRDLGMSRDLYSNLMKQYANTKDSKKRKDIENRMKGLKKEMDNLEVRLEEMKDLMEQPL